MFTSTISLFAFTVLACLSHAGTIQNIGYSGTLSSLDGGLGGTVTVTDANTLTITNYKLKDASAPALYWWGTTDGVIKDGFRISSTQVTQAATSDTLIIKLDAGKTAADFDTVGLWCERLNANFGQATLKAAGGTAGGVSTTSSSTAASTTSSGGAAATTSTKSGAASGMVSLGVVAGAFVVAAGFAVLMG